MSSWRSGMRSSLAPNRDPQAAKNSPIPSPRSFNHNKSAPCSYQNLNLSSRSFNEANVFNISHTGMNVGPWSGRMTWLIFAPKWRCVKSTLHDNSKRIPLDSNRFNTEPGGKRATVAMGGVARLSRWLTSAPWASSNSIFRSMSACLSGFRAQTFNTLWMTLGVFGGFNISGVIDGWDNTNSTSGVGHAAAANNTLEFAMGTPKAINFCATGRIFLLKSSNGFQAWWNELSNNLFLRYSQFKNGRGDTYVNKPANKLLSSSEWTSAPWSNRNSKITLFESLHVPLSVLKKDANTVRPNFPLSASRLGSAPLLNMNSKNFKDGLGLLAA